jgi:hypothetical protein
LRSLLCYGFDETASIAPKRSNQIKGLQMSLPKNASLYAAAAAAVVGLAGVEYNAFANRKPEVVISVWTAADASKAIENLKSDNPILRSNARYDLVACGVKAVAPMMDAWRQDAGNYRLTEGIVVALNDMLRIDDPRMALDVSRKLKGDDIQRLVDAANAPGETHKTVRLQATELLYVLKDNRVVPASILAARSADANGAFNDVLIVKAVFQNAEDSDKRNILGDLGRNIPADFLNARRLLQTLKP